MKLKNRLWKGELGKQRSGATNGFETNVHGIETLIKMFAISNLFTNTLTIIFQCNGIERVLRLHHWSSASLRGIHPTHSFLYSVSLTSSTSLLDFFFKKWYQANWTVPLFPFVSRGWSYSTYFCLYTVLCLLSCVVCCFCVCVCASVWYMERKYLFVSILKKIYSRFQWVKCVIQIIYIIFC